MMRPEQLNKLDAQIIQIAKSTRTSLPFLIPAHDWLRLHLNWYYNWHLNQLAPLIHQALLLFALIIGGILIITIIGSGFILGLIYSIK